MYLTNICHYLLSSSSTLAMKLSFVFMSKRKILFMFMFFYFFIFICTSLKPVRCMHGFVSKNDRKEKIIIISECISDGRKKKSFK
jgi:hypothetical protein